MATATSPTSLSSDLAARIQEKQAEAAERYRQLIRDAADGGEVDPGEALQILENAGKDATDFDKDLAEIEHRKALQEQAGEADDLRAELRKVDADIVAARNKLADYHSQKEAEIAALAEQHREFSTKLHRAEDAATQLWKECGDPDLLGELADVEQRLRAAVDFHVRCRESLTRIRNGRRDAEADLRLANTPEKVADAEERLAKLQTVEAAQDRFDNATAAREKVEAEEREIRKRMVFA